MKTGLKFLLSLAAVAAMTGSASAAIIQAYDATGANTGGAPGSGLNIGREFQVTGTGIYITSLGVYDNGADGLVNAHDVTLFDISSTPAALATVNVAAGTGELLSGGFRFADLGGGPIFLAAGNYAVIAYGLDSAGDPYGDGGGTPNGSNNVTNIGFDPYQFSAPGSPSFPTGGDGNNHSGASFLYSTTPVPETSHVLLAAVGGLALAGFARRRLFAAA